MATNYFTSLPAPEIRNALVNFQPMTNAFEAVRDQNNENRNALMRQQQMDAQQEERTYQRGRDQVADQRQYAKQLGDFGVAVQREQDPARRQALWNRTLAFHKQYFPGQTLTPEEMDINTGPTLLAAEVGKVFDPRDDRMKDLDLQYKQAQIGKLNREATEAGADFGKAGTIVQDAQGNFYSVQFGAKGQRKVEPLQLGDTRLSPSRGVEIVGDEAIDKATAQPVRNVARNLEAGERAKVLGRDEAEKIAAFPKVSMAYQQFRNKADTVRSTIKSARDMISPWTTGYGGAALQYMPASEARALRGYLDTIRAYVGFNELTSMRENSPTGGALGNVSERENILLQSTTAAIDQLMAGKDLDKNLAIIDSSLDELMKLKEGQFNQDSQRYGQQPQASASPNNPSGGDGWTTLPNGIRIREKR